MASEAPAPLTPAVFALLLALASDPGGERHGYALMADVERLTDGTIRLGAGTLYRSLQRMRVDGLVTEIETPTGRGTDPDADRRAERRRSYRITDAGTAAARAEAHRLAGLVAAARAAHLLEEIPAGDLAGDGGASHDLDSRP